MAVLNGFNSRRNLVEIVAVSFPVRSSAARRKQKGPASLRDLSVSWWSLGGSNP